MNTAPTYAALQAQLRRIDDLKRANVMAALDYQVTATEFQLRADQLGNDELVVLSQIATHYPMSAENGERVSWDEIPVFWTDPKSHRKPLTGPVEF